jgi:hypothetical protein
MPPGAALGAVETLCVHVHRCGRNEKQASPLTNCEVGSSGFVSALGRVVSLSLGCLEALC